MAAGAVAEGVAAAGTEAFTGSPGFTAGAVEGAGAAAFTGSAGLPATGVVVVLVAGAADFAASTGFVTAVAAGAVAAGAVKAGAVTAGVAGAVTGFASCANTGVDRASTNVAAAIDLMVI